MASRLLSTRPSPELVDTCRRLNWSCGRRRVLVEHVLELGRAHHAQRRVPTTTVVEHFDVFVNGPSRRITGRPRVPVDQLGLERTKEVLDYGVVEAVRAPPMLQFEAGPVTKTLRFFRRALSSLLAACDAYETVRKTIKYFTRNRQRMRYAEFIARGLPIGSGPVESAAKTIVQARLKRSGMHWSHDGGQVVLDLRTFVKSNRWEPMWNAYLEAA